MTLDLKLYEDTREVFSVEVIQFERSVYMNEKMICRTVKQNTVLVINGSTLKEMLINENFYYNWELLRLKNKLTGACKQQKIIDWCLFTMINKVLFLWAYVSEISRVLQTYILKGAIVFIYSSMSFQFACKLHFAGNENSEPQPSQEIETRI